MQTELNLELPFAVRRREGFGFSEIGSAGYAYVRADEGLIEKLDQDEDIGLFVPVENKKAYGGQEMGLPNSRQPKERRVL